MTWSGFNVNKNKSTGVRKTFLRQGPSAKRLKVRSHRFKSPVQVQSCVWIFDPTFDHFMKYEKLRRWTQMLEVNWFFFYLHTTKWHTLKGKQEWPEGKARSLIFRRGKPQGGCFPLAQGPLLWWPLAACLPRPPVSNGVWSWEPEISGKAELHLPGLVDSWKQNSQLCSGLAPDSVQLLWEGTPREPLEEPLREPPAYRTENLDMCHSHNLQSCVLWNRYMTPWNFTKLF